MGGGVRSRGGGEEINGQESGEGGRRLGGGDFFGWAGTLDFRLAIFFRLGPVS